LKHTQIILSKDEEFEKKSFNEVACPSTALAWAVPMKEDHF
jgi:hypothetical protein